MNGVVDVLKDEEEVNLVLMVLVCFSVVSVCYIMFYVVLWFGFFFIWNIYCI